MFYLCGIQSGINVLLAQLLGIAEFRKYIFYAYSPLCGVVHSVNSIFLKALRGSLFSPHIKRAKGTAEGALLNYQQLQLREKTSCAVYHPVVFRVTGFSNAQNCGLYLLKPLRNTLLQTLMWIPHQNYFYYH